MSNEKSNESNEKSNESSNDRSDAMERALMGAISGTSGPAECLIVLMEATMTMAIASNVGLADVALYFEGAAQKSLPDSAREGAIVLVQELIDQTAQLMRMAEAAAVVERAAAIVKSATEKEPSDAR